MIPRMATGAPMPDMSESVRKKQPMGTPALPIAETTDIKIHSKMVPRVSGVPPFCMTKREVTRMKAAQPFILMQNGGTPLTLGTILLWILISVVSAIGNAGVPMGCFFLTLSLMSGDRKSVV